MKSILCFLSCLLLCLSAQAQAPSHHRFGWVSDPHHAQHTGPDFVHAKVTRGITPDIVDLSGCMPDSGVVSAPLAVHMPAIYDQGQEGSCTANAGTGAMEFLWHKTFGVFIAGSRQGLYSMELIHDGNWPRDAGSMTSSIVWVLQQQGLGQEDLFPYSTPLTTPLPQTYIADASTRFVTHAYDVDSTDHVSIQTALANGLPVMFGGFVYQSIEQVTSEARFNRPASGQGAPLGGHERLIVGYNRTLKHTFPAQWLFGHDVTLTGFYWVRNSWGTGWGYQGYCWEPMSEIENTKLNEDFAVADIAAGPVATSNTH